MNIGIYNPYLDTLGGHERYCLDIAASLIDTHTIDIFWDDPSIINKAEERFSMDLRGVCVVPNIWKNTGLLVKLRESKKYDLVFIVSDGSIPLSLSQKTFLLFEFPVPWVKGKKLFTQAKIHRISSIICNSLFVKQHIDMNFGVNSKVLFPGVDTRSFAPGKKQKLIISVGRFTTGMNTKKQEVLIDSFKIMCDRGLKDWRLVLSGGMLPGDRVFVDALEKQSKKYPITIIPNASFEALRSLYADASIYWHAAGFGEDLDKHPERAEHFGISTVESMSAGAVPVVFAGGGQKEVVTEDINGLLWKTQEELIHQTQLIISERKMLARLSKAAQLRAKDFSREQFRKQLKSLF